MHQLILTNKNGSIQWFPQTGTIIWNGYLPYEGQHVELNSINFIGSNANLYGLAYITDESGELWTNNIRFESGLYSMRCYNETKKHTHLYKSGCSMVFVLADGDGDPIAPSYEDISITLSFY